MYNIGGLIPTRFLSLLAHLVVSISLLWGSRQSVMNCLSVEVTEMAFKSHQYQLVVGLSLALGMIAFELLSFLSGVTMFHSTSALLSIGCHCSATIALTYFILDSWQCGWFWWVFVLCSVLPALMDLCIDEYVSSTVHRSGWSFRLVTAAVATTIGASVPVGYNLGVVNAPAGMIKVFCNESMYTRFDVVMGKAELDILWSAIVSVFLIGGITGSLSGSWLADKVGRKGAYVIGALLHIVGGVMFYACVPANSVEMLLLGRLLVGLAGGLITGIVPMYLTELSPLQLRGAMGVMCPLGLTVGVLVAQVAGLREILGTEETWPELLAFFVILVTMCGLVTPILPESPKYLYVIRNQPQLALKELSKIRGVPISSLTEEVRDLQQAQRVAAQTEVSWNIATVLKDKELLLPLLLVCFMQAGQQFSGINAVFFYSVSIFESTGMNEQQSQLGNIGCGGANLLMGIVSIFVMSHCNRRTIFLISCVTACISLVLLGVSIALIKVVSWMSYVSIVAIVSFVLFYGLGLGPIPYFVGSELFEVGPRPSAMALGSMSNWGANFVVGMTFPTLQSAIGPAAFGIFAIITLALFFFLRRYMPETRGRDPSDIASLCKYGLRSRPLDTPSSTNTEEVNDIKSIQ